MDLWVSKEQNATYKRKKCLNANSKKRGMMAVWAIKGMKWARCIAKHWVGLALPAESADPRPTHAVCFLEQLYAVLNLLLQEPEVTKHFGPRLWVLLSYPSSSLLDNSALAFLSNNKALPAQSMQKCLQGAQSNSIFQFFTHSRNMYITLKN